VSVDGSDVLEKTDNGEPGGIRTLGQLIKSLFRKSHGTSRKLTKPLIRQQDPLLRFSADSRKLPQIRANLRE
jgi:hypothetical protein